MSGSADFTAQGLAVGHATDHEGWTGVTVVRGLTTPFRASAVAIGRATSTRQFDALSPNHIVSRVDAILMCGGSAFGLDCAAGAMRWMEERGRGFPVGDVVVPIIPAAVVFDLGPLGGRSARPTPEMAYQACESATSSGFAEGSVGAGAGATVGKAAGIDRCMKGGVGSGMRRAARLSVSALAVVNAFGNVSDEAGRVIAGARAGDGSFVDARRVLAEEGAQSRFRAASEGNTTLALVSVSSVLSRAALHQLASAASAALFRRISPAGTSVDGDIVFAVSPLEGTPANAMSAEVLAVEALEEAIEGAVRAARGTAAVPSISDLASGRT